ncbi:hypothetical protein LWI29_037130 [Acer saccharum]|uniref:Non-haem dioxygenase N-terminal domain-containing protein n=1 Tax=Acer saccharum TaxID=4024 RepID=A0AA39RHU3_ACESA|nr:hypothetical protein LWI29_037130 [Acer saccharum]
MNNNNSVSASFKTNPTINLNHIIPLDFKTVLKLPESRSWSTTTTSTHVEVDEGVPMVDLADPEAVTLIRGACEKWGMFQVTNHGVPIKLLKQIEFQSKRLFGLPTNQKLLAVRSSEECTGYGLPRISTFFSKLFWSEDFSSMGSPLHHARQHWPNHHFDFCNVMVEYQKELMGLTERIMGLMLHHWA